MALDPLLSVPTFLPALQSTWNVLSHHLWFFTGVCCSLVVTMDILSFNKEQMLFVCLMITKYISFMWGMWGIKISLEIDNVCLRSNLAQLGYYIIHWLANIINMFFFITIFGLWLLYLVLCSWGTLIRPSIPQLPLRYMHLICL